MAASKITRSQGNRLLFDDCSSPGARESLVEARTFSVLAIVRAGSEISFDPLGASIPVAFHVPVWRYVTLDVPQKN
jgi:hypothetical protein